MTKTTLDVIGEQEEFSGVSAEEFAQAFQKQTIKISEAAKERIQPTTNLAHATFTFVQRTEPLQFSK